MAELTIPHRVARMTVIAHCFFQSFGSDDPDRIAIDLLADLKHWCADNEVDFDDMLSAAHVDYLRQQDQERLQ